MHKHYLSGTKEELLHAEADLQARGFRLVDKREEELESLEYVITVKPASQDSHAVEVLCWLED